MLWLWLVLLIVALVLIFIKVTAYHNEYYWKRRGVVFYPENKVMGPWLNFILEDRALFEIYQDIYDKYSDEPAIGVGGFWTPNLFLTDPTNIQHILSTDFSSFNHRGFEPIDGDLLSDNILFQNGPKWKLVRQNMTPIFTSAKLKNMYYIIDKSAKDFVDYLKQNPERFKSDTFEAFSSFCSAAISGAVFGIGTESVFDSPFLKMAQKSIEQSFVRNLKFALALFAPGLLKLFRIQIFKEHEDFFVGAIRKVIEERRATNVKKHDFADLCLNIQDKGTMVDKSTNYEIEPSVELFAAQAFFFFIAGVEPSALSGYVTLLELGRNPEYLKLVHEEIDAAFETHDQLTFDVINGLEVLDKVYNESMRIHPPVSNLTRQCTKDTELPVGNIKVAKGTQLTFSVYGAHHDKKIFRDPETFDPERWAPGGDGNRDLFMPFGKGNRLCVGARYASLQVKAGLVHLLRHFTVKTHVLPGPPKYKKHQIQVFLLNLKVELLPRNLK